MNKKSSSYYVSKGRRLVAILFADIVSYSALLQKNEKNALALVDKFDRVIKEQAEKFEADIQHFRGDGCMITFDSILNSINFALSVQEQFTQDTKVPVRIGIHKGEVIFDKNTVYGDSVNIAARIEAVALPQSIYISKEIRDQLVNKPIALKFVGKRRLKNIEEAVELYAVEAPFLNSEKSKRDFKTTIDELNRRALGISGILFLFLAIIVILIGTKDILLNKATSPSEGAKVIAISNFENKTNNTELENFGEFTSDYISRSLLQVHPLLMPTRTGEHLVYKQSFISSSNSGEYGDADLLIEGKFFQEDAELTLHAQLIDVASKNLVYSFPTVRGKLEEKPEIVKELTQYILGYWSVDKADGLKRKPPKYQAYKLYLKALEAHANRDTLEVESNFREAFNVDSTFYDALVTLGYHYYNFKQFDKLENLVEEIDSKEKYFDEYESLQASGLEALFAGNLQKEASIYQELAKMQPYGANYKCASALFRINDPKAALEFADKELTNIKYTGSPLHQKVISIKARALLELDRYEEAKELLDSIDFVITANTIPGIYAGILGAIPQIIGGDELRQQFGTSEYIRKYPLMMEFNLCYSLYMNDKAEMESYCKEALHLFEKEAHRKEYDIFKVFIHIMNEEYQLAYNLLSKPHNKSALAELMYCANKLGLHKDAEQYKERVEKIIADNSSNSSKKAEYTYKLASYYVGSGDYDQAVEKLIEAHRFGFGFSWIGYNNDMLCKEMRGFEAFDKFVMHEE